MNGYYSVFNPKGEKIADCGALRDAVNLVGMRGEGHYYTFKPVYETVDVHPWDMSLPSITIGGQTLPIQQKLQKSESKELDL